MQRRIHFDGGYIVQFSFLVTNENIVYIKCLCFAHFDKMNVFFLFIGVIYPY